MFTTDPSKSEVTVFMVKECPTETNRNTCPMETQRIPAAAGRHPTHKDADTPAGTPGAEMLVWKTSVGEEADGKVLDPARNKPLGRKVHKHNKQEELRFQKRGQQNDLKHGKKRYFRQQRRGENRYQKLKQGIIRRTKSQKARGGGGNPVSKTEVWNRTN